MKINQITESIIGAAMEVHRTIGPGLLESTYVQCLCYELALREIPFLRELPLPVRYKGVKLDCGYRLDIVVADAVVVAESSRSTSPDIESMASNPTLLVAAPPIRVET
jgi:GxxExxY protein